MSYSKYEHFKLEKELADKLRQSTLDERRVLYRQVYTDFFTRFPEVGEGLNISKTDRLAWQLKLMKPLLNKEKTVLEIGAGDCLVSKELCKHFKKVIGYEVADSIPFIEGKPENFELKIFNGFDMHEQPGSVDIVYSNQVFEHLHPDDTAPLLRNYHTYLRKGGKVVIITPHIATGPHDVSRDFTKTPEGFHLKEYTYSEMSSLLKANGFHKIKGYIGYSKIGYYGVPVALMSFAEKIYNLIPGALRRKLKNNSLVFNFFGLKIIAEKKN